MPHTDTPRSAPTQLDDLPRPESYYRLLKIGSRSTFWRWEKQGLSVLHVGRRRLIRPSDLDTFLEVLSAREKSNKVEVPHTDTTPTAQGGAAQ